MKYLRTLCGALTAVALVATPFAVFAQAAPAKVTICHATSSQSNPYVTIHTSENAINGHFENNGTTKAGHEDDILLQGHVDCPTTPPGGGNPPPGNPNKITICHATGSATNPYVVIHTDDSAVNGHFENNGTTKAGHEDDILLQGHVDCPGGGTGGSGGDTGGLVVIKNVVNDNGGIAQAADFTISVQSATTSTNVANSPAPGNAAGTAYTLPIGSYVVSELASSTYTSSFSGACDQNGNVTVTAGATSTCTITNNDIAQNGGGGSTSTPMGGLIVQKVVVNNDGGTATSSDFQITVTNASSTQVAGSPFAGAAAGTVFTLPIGTYTVGEIASSSYTASFSGACNSSGAVSVSAGATSTCVITNNDIATSSGGGGGGTCTNNCGLGLLTIIKHTLGGNGTFDFSISGATNATTSITTINGRGVAIVPLLHFGTTSISENAQAGWSMNGISCTQNGFAAGATTTAGFSFNVKPMGEVVICNVYNATSTATSTPGGGNSTSTPPTSTTTPSTGGGGGGGGGGSSGGGGGGGGGNGPIVGSIGGTAIPGPTSFLPGGSVLGESISIPVVNDGVGGFVPGIPNTGSGGGANAALALMIAAFVTFVFGSKTLFRK